MASSLSPGSDQRTGGLVMDLRRLQMCVKGGAATKAIMLRTGVTPSGSKVWASAEEELCRRLSHDRDALKRALPSRTAKGIEQKCRRLGLVKKLNAWTSAAITRLRRLYPTASWPELMEAFPGRSRRSISEAAWKRGLYRSRKPYKITGDHFVDQFKQRCFELNVTLRDLNDAVGNRYFLTLHKERSRRRARLSKALHVLNGQLTVEWRGLEGN